MVTLRIGTRGSQLALYQARVCADLLRDRLGASCEILVIRTSGDRLAEAPLSAAGGKRLFVKEIEDALLDGGVDLAVHSSKDLPAVLPTGLTIAAVLPRDDPRDAIVLPGAPPAMTLEEALNRLPAAPRIGTSSLRRAAQLGRLMPDGRFLPVRGNLDTRLRKLDAGGFDALVLAAAGLNRLQMRRRISAPVPVETCVPAPGQGLIAVEMREDDRRTAAMVGAIGDIEAARALEAERAVVAGLGGGCQMPIGAYAEKVGSLLSLTAIVLAPDGSREARVRLEGSPSDAAALGARAAGDLLALGAADILAALARPPAADASRT